MHEKLVHTALDNFRNHTGIAVVYKATLESGLDGEVEFEFQGGKENFTVEVKKEIRSYQLSQIIERAKNHNNFLLIAETIFPQIKDALRKAGIGYLDIAGNIFLKTDKNHLWIEGQKAHKKDTEKPNRAFTATGLKAVFQFLLDDALLNQPQRVIAEKAGVALGNINNIISSLKEQKFVIHKNKKEYILIHKKELLDRWVTGFEKTLKPTLHLGNFRFLKKEDYNQWKEIALKKQQTFWGAEPAGALITKYLLPEIFTLYTEETRSDLIKNYRLVPEPNGNVRLYKKFWKYGETFNETVANPLLVYADLVNAGDRRSMETAQKIYDELLHQRFQ